MKGIVLLVALAATLASYCSASSPHHGFPPAEAPPAQAPYAEAPLKPHHGSEHGKHHHHDGATILPQLA
nr:unnamed protein product [Digitaria exilis]